MSKVGELAERVGPAVVGMGRGSRGGSGVLFGPGLMATLARNVRDGELELRMGEGEKRDGQVLGIDDSVDLAVIRVSGAGGGSTAAWSTAPSSPALGEEVYAFADPAGRGLRVTPGTVASTPRAVRGPAGRLIPGVIEHTAPMLRGSGGGPLTDASGAVVGLNALRQDDGLLLAWPATVLRERAASLAQGVSPAPRQLGIALAGPRRTRRLRAAVGLEPLDGLLVTGLQHGSPASRAGVLRGDVIVGAKGMRVTGLDDLYGALDAVGNAPLDLELVRGSDHVDVEVEGAGVSA